MGQYSFPRWLKISVIALGAFWLVVGILVLTEATVGISERARLRFKAKRRIPEAMWRYGGFLIENKPNNYYDDVAEGYEWIKRAAECGHLASMNYLGNAYSGSYDLGTRRSALSWYEKAAVRGDVLSMHELANAYDFGLLGEAKDPVKAAYWRHKVVEARDEEAWGPTRRRAASGDTVAMMHLAKTAEESPKPDAYTDAVAWYTKAAEAGDREAMMRLVNAYQWGQIGLPKDQARSEAWFRRWQDATRAERNKQKR